ncbi:hypothetical protein [Streptomyces sp. NPDC047071]|uniref:tetratricopeptide repeat protein n=1 Tax=Streptomyces sp. NPDC047071 TaxID=3154808 RepID=UPI003456C086
MSRQQYGPAVPGPHETAHYPLLPAHRARPLEPSVVQAIESRITSLAMLDDSMGSGRLLHTAASEISMISNLLAQDRASDPPTARALQTLAAYAAAAGAWMSFDAGRHSVADSYYRFGLRAAASANFGYLQAYLQTMLAMQLCELGQTSEVATLLRAAEVAARPGGAARVTALTQVVHALVQAHRGDPFACQRALDEARTTLQSEAEVDPVVLTYWVTDAWIEICAGTALLRLGQPREAINHFRLLDSGGFPVHQYPRDAAIYFSRAATAQLGAGHIDAAVIYAHRALDLLEGICSARATEAVTRVGRALSRGQQSVTVREFTVRLREQSSPLRLADGSRNEGSPED